jgi:outer membrane protein assembly factor BamB
VTFNGKKPAFSKNPRDGPKVIWRQKIGPSYSGLAVAEVKVFIMDSLTNDQVREGNWDCKLMSGIERVYYLNAADGKEVWNQEYTVKYSIRYPDSPRCTTVMNAGKVYTLGAAWSMTAFADKECSLATMKKSSASILGSSVTA